MNQQAAIPTVSTPAPARSGDMDLGYLLALCWDRRRFILGLTAACTALGVVYALLATPIYRADALLQVEKPSSGVAQSEVMFLMGQEGTTSATQIEILRSRMVLGQAAEQLGLDLVLQPHYLPVVGKALVRYGVERPEFAQGWPQVWANEGIDVGQLLVDPSLYGERLTLTVESGPAYRLESEDGLLLGRGQAGETLSRESPYMELLVNTLQAPPGSRFTLIKRSPAAAVRSLQQRFSVSERGRESGILELSLTGEDAGEIARTLDAISQVYLVQNINRQSAEAEKRLAFLEEQAPDIRGLLTESEDRLNAYRAAQESVDLSFETQSLLQQLVLVEGQVSELQMREADLAERFTRSHPSFRTLLEKKNQLVEEKARLERQVESLPDTQQQVLRLNRDVEVTQQIYMQMLNTMQELRIARAGTVGNVRILDEALVGQQAVAPKRSLLVIMAGLAGLLLSLLLVVLRKLANKGVESVDQLMEMGLPVYATVPLSDDQLKLIRKSGRRKAARRSKRAAGGLRKQELGGILAFSNPTDLSIEALRSLRTSLHFAMLEAGNNNCLMITGASPAVGKSFIAANLAAVCAQAGQRILLVDADMRKGHVHSAFHDSNELGLSELLAGRIDRETATRHTGLDGLDFIPRGKAPPNPSELLMHPNFQQFLREACQDYELVIIDTPPVLAVTDAAIIGKLAGTTLLVVRSGLNPPKEIERALQQLDNAGVLVKGTILNAIERSATASYGYGYGYGYGSYNYAYRSDTASG